MQQMTFKTVKCNVVFNRSGKDFDFLLQKPLVCPYCDAYEDGTKLDAKLFSLGNNHYYGAVSYTCTCCCKIYLVVYEIDTFEKVSECRIILPQTTRGYQNERLNELSPRFIDMYNQAFRAEQIGDIDLAAIGFRNALECLVKDFAINELQKPKEEVVRKKLYNAIGDYLDSSLVSTADVVRILGNDYAHYERRYDQHDFDVLKGYMQIFIHLIETKLMIAHPPVSR